MSGPNAAHALPPERELPLSQELDAPPAPEPPMKRPGIKFDLGSIKAMLDEAYSALADANLANEQDNLASLAAEFLKISSIAIADRCLNCDVQTVFTGQLCIECDACVDICPMDCITFTFNGEEADLRTRLKAPAKDRAQDLYVADDLKTGRVMVKDEDVCLHCGLCAERCPTGAWDMQKYLIDMTHAEQACRSKA